MNKTSFINIGLFARLTFYAVLVVLVWRGWQSWQAGETLGLVLYFCLAFILCVLDSLNRIWNRLEQMRDSHAAILSLMPYLGKAIDTVGDRSVETHRLVMHKLLSDDEKGKMIDITHEVYGAEPAAKLEKYLLVGPLESIINDRDEKQFMAEGEDIPQ